MRFAALVISFALLAGCATPRQTCVRHAYADLRQVQSQIAQSRKVIEQGYTLETRDTPKFGFALCHGAGAIHACYRNNLNAGQRRIPADTEAEMAKLKVLMAKEQRLKREASQRVAMCRNLYPDPV